jgi:hypothetical protein
MFRLFLSPKNVVNGIWQNQEKVGGDYPEVQQHIMPLNNVFIFHFYYFVAILLQVLARRKYSVDDNNALIYTRFQTKSIGPKHCEIIRLKNFQVRSKMDAKNHMLKGNGYR